MRKLGFPESGWRDLAPGVRVHFAPIGIKAVRLARAACGATLRDTDDFQEASDALSRELIRLGITEWEGVGDREGVAVEPHALVPMLKEDGTALLDADGKQRVTPAIDLFIADPELFEAAERIYVRPWLERDREGNASAGSSNGTSGEATPASNIASSPADMEGRPEALAAKSALTSKTSRSRKKAKPSSRS